MAGMQNIHTINPPLKLVPLEVTENLVESQLVDKGQDLKSAFDLFNEMSQQLTDSYFMLENRVAELNQELNTVADQRMQELAEKEKIANRLENLLNFLPGGVVVLDSSGRISECNPAAIDLLGEPLRGKLWREVIVRSFAPRQDDGHEVSLRDGRRISISTRNQGEDGQIILLTDQTETRRLQSQLSRHERLSALGKMMSALAHQIRTPLSAAMLYAGHLCNSKLDDEKRHQFSEKICNRLNNIERQVQDMLVFAKGELPLKDIVSVNELQHAFAEAMEVPLMTTESACVWHNDCGEQVIQCNREALIGALLNLVNNAIQVVERNAKLRITFTSTQPKNADEDPQLMIAVCDAGPGIAPELLPNLGDLFVTTKAQGTGLGLAVVKAVARAHHGNFSLQSTVGQGTCASLFMPFAILSKS
jgi:two-component system, sensor histidine kinase FlrB